MGKKTQKEERSVGGLAQKIGLTHVLINKMTGTVHKVVEETKKTKSSDKLFGPLVMTDD